MSSFSKKDELQRCWGRDNFDNTRHEFKIQINSLEVAACSTNTVFSLEMSA